MLGSPLRFAHRENSGSKLRYRIADHRQASELEKLPIRVLAITGGLMLPQFLLLLLIPTVLSALKSFI
jgi:hypothetical protein